MGGGGPGDAGGSLAARRALADPELRHFDLAGFELDCGVRLPEGATLVYRVHGPPIDASHEGSNRVILHPTAFDGVHDELEFQIGPDETLDTDVFTVVTANMLGNGVSFSPSMMTADRQNERGTMTPPPNTVADVREGRNPEDRSLGMEQRRTTRDRATRALAAAGGSSRRVQSG
eukprot:g5102.t1